MDVIVDALGKRFQREWIFRNVCFSFLSGTSTAITGNNGSGKSTLLQVLAGALPATEGTIKYQIGSEQVSLDKIYKHFSIATPYLELVEDFTLQEMFDFHRTFKKISLSFDAFEDILAINAQDKVIKNFSSGMKQKLKLALSFYSDTALLLLDEPTSNLDKLNTQWYFDRIEEQVQLKTKTIIVCSNIPEEYTFCDTVLSINHYK